MRCCVLFICFICFSVCLQLLCSFGFYMCLCVCVVLFVCVCFVGFLFVYYVLFLYFCIALFVSESVVCLRLYVFVMSDMSMFDLFAFCV